jgi:hypothetical protein
MACLNAVSVSRVPYRKYIVQTTIFASPNSGFNPAFGLSNNFGTWAMNMPALYFISVNYPVISHNGRYSPMNHSSKDMYTPHD